MKEAILPDISDLLPEVRNADEIVSILLKRGKFWDREDELREIVRMEYWRYKRELFRSS